MIRANYADCKRRDAVKAILKCQQDEFRRGKILTQKGYEIKAIEVFASATDREEHALVVEDVARALEPLCEEIRYPPEPELLGTANVWHLATPFHGRLEPSVRSALDLVAALHPTPAVCGTPRDAASSVLAELEPLDRGCYAGPVGWVDVDGDGEWAIALRCAEITGTTARVFAGAGIVPDSRPEQEVDETERPAATLLQKNFF